MHAQMDDQGLRGRAIERQRAFSGVASTNVGCSVIHSCNGSINLGELRPRPLDRGGVATGFERSEGVEVMPALALHLQLCLTFFAQPAFPSRFRPRTRLSAAAL